MPSFTQGTKATKHRSSGHRSSQAPNLFEAPPLEALKTPPSHLRVRLCLGAHDAGEGGRGEADGPVDLARHRLGDGIKDRNPAATQLGRPGRGGGGTTGVTDIPRVEE